MNIAKHDLITKLIVHCVRVLWCDDVAIYSFSDLQFRTLILHQSLPSH